MRYVVTILAVVLLGGCSDKQPHIARLDNLTEDVLTAKEQMTAMVSSIESRWTSRELSRQFLAYARLDQTNDQVFVSLVYVQIPREIEVSSHLLDKNGNRWPNEAEVTIVNEGMVERIDRYLLPNIDLLPCSAVFELR